MTTPESQNNSKFDYLGVVFLVLILLSPFAYLHFSAEEAEVFLIVASDQSAQSSTIKVEGMAVLGGSPVASGVVHIVVVEARKNRYLTSVALNIGPNGKFGLAQIPIVRENGLNAFKVTAQFRGPARDGEETLVAESTVYINYPPPLRAQTVWAVFGALLLFGLALIYLFVSEMTKFKLKILYGAMYFITFTSLAVPVAVTVLVAQNSYLVELMADAPIGLVKGKATGVDAPQWLINIGGIVHGGTPAAPPAAPEAVNTDVPSDDLSALSVGTDHSVATMLDEPIEGVPKTPDKPVAAEAEGQKSPSVEGGLAIPFYVILLAMFGAAINMTLKVPQIQGDFQDAYESLPTQKPVLKALFKVFSVPDAQLENYPIHEISAIRRKLIQNFMYLMSAPFLAIAVYYLLQVVANQVAQPMLVVMGFATGLTSDTIVRRILELARTSLGGRAKSEADMEGEVANIKIAAKPEIAKYKMAAEIADAKKNRALAEFAQLQAEQNLEKIRAQPPATLDGSNENSGNSGDSNTAENAADPNANAPK